MSMFNYLVNTQRKKLPLLLKSFEVFLAFVVLAGVVATIWSMVPSFVSMDWGTRQSLTDLLHIVLVLAIGVELARLLISYNLDTLVELVAFVIARKMLLIEDSFVDALLGTVALTLIFSARYFFLTKSDKPEGTV